VTGSDVTLLRDLVQFVEAMKTPKQKRTLMKDGEVVATLTKEADPTVYRKKLETLCLGRDIHTEAPPKTMWKYRGSDYPYSHILVTLSYVSVSKDFSMEMRASPLFLNHFSTSS
jgi:hypothetical protein